MNNRERLLAAMRCAETDAIPISPLGINKYEIDSGDPAFASFRPVLDVLEKHGTPFVRSWLWTPPFLLDPVDAHIRTEKKQVGPVTYTKEIIPTPAGDLTALKKFDPRVSNTAAHEKQFIETEEDFDKFISLKKCRTFLPDLSETRELQNKVGNDGLISMHSISSPFCLTSELTKYDFFLITAITREDYLNEIIKINFQRMKDFLSFLIDAKAGPVYRLYNFEGYTTPMLPPEWGTQWVVPYDRELVKMIHDAGGFVDNHCHGQLRDQVGNFMSIGIDCIDCIEPPPANDIDLKEFKERTRGKICCYGYIQLEDLERKTPPEIRKLTREALEMSGNRGFILSQAASFHTSTMSKEFSDNIIAMIEEGAAYNAETFGISA